MIHTVKRGCVTVPILLFWSCQGKHQHHNQCPPLELGYVLHFKGQTGVQSLFVNVRM